MGLELRECPFCGHKAEIVQAHEYGCSTKLIQIKCRGCGAGTKEIRVLDNFNTEDQIQMIIDLWNTRRRKPR